MSLLIFWVKVAVPDFLACSHTQLSFAWQGSHIAVPTSDGDVTTVEATWASGPTDLAAVHQSEGWATVAAKVSHEQGGLCSGHMIHSLE